MRWFTRDQGALHSVHAVPPDPRRSIRSRFSPFVPERGRPSRTDRSRGQRRDHRDRPRWRGDARSGSVPGHGDRPSGRKAGLSCTISEPLIIPASDRSGFSAGNGWLKLRGAPGVSPVIVVEIKGQRPFLTVGSGMSLVLEGLTIVARYTDQSPDARDGPPPIILAGGPVQLRHCAFLLEGSCRTTRLACDHRGRGQSDGRELLVQRL